MRVADFSIQNFRMLSQSGDEEKMGLFLVMASSRSFTGERIKGFDLTFEEKQLQEIKRRKNYGKKIGEKRMDELDKNHGFDDKQANGFCQECGQEQPDVYTYLVEDKNANRINRLMFNQADFPSVRKAVCMSCVNKLEKEGVRFKCI